MYEPGKRGIDPSGGRFDIGPEMTIPRHPALWLGKWTAEITGPRQARLTSVEDKETADKFLKEVDASAVFHNASTRLHDGGIFGLGAEIGISTGKLHARGTMGLKELTTTKYIIHGSGQIRE